MRKIKKESKIMNVNGVLAIIERIKNDNYGNPKYQVQFINTRELNDNSVLMHNTIYNNQYYNIVSYDIESDVLNYINANIINNMEV